MPVYIYNMPLTFKFLFHVHTKNRPPCVLMLAVYIMTAATYTKLILHSIRSLHSAAMVNNGNSN